MRYVDRDTNTPLVAVSNRPSLENKTGGWRFARPVFVDRVAPCSRQCPAGEDIAGMLFLASQGRYEDAWRLIVRENPFPAVMGRVCYHTCEQRCNRAEHDEAVSIHSVERFLGDYALERGLQVEDLPEEGEPSVAVVGAGPSGLSAAYHLRRMGYRLTVLDAMERPGGLMQYGIPAYRLPRDVLDGEIARLERMGVRFEMGRKVGGEKVWADLATEHDAVFLAIGAHREARLDLEGESLDGVFRALPFLADVNHGSFPALGEHVAVIGGGNSAIDCARVCRRLGAKVSVFYRRSEAEMPAHPEEVALAREEGVAFEFLRTPEAILGPDRVRGVRLARMELGEPDETGRRRPVPTGKTLDAACTGLILAVGESPDPESLPGGLELDTSGVPSDAFGRTGLAKVFVGGDLAPIPRTVTHAIGSGKRAAAAIQAFLSGKGPEHVDILFRWGDTGNVCLGDLEDRTLFPRRNPIPEVVEYDGLNPFYFDRRPALSIRNRSVEERLGGFDEVVSGPTEAEALAEAARCFNCGSCTECGNCYLFCPDVSVLKDPGGFGYAIDLDYCKGCGICVHECPRGAMTMSFGEGMP